MPLALRSMFTVTTMPRFDDVDRAGIVNNARFLTYAEEGRIAFLTTHALVGRALVVRRIECDYLRPILRERGPVDVTVSVARVGGSSVTFDQVLIQAGETAARIVVVVVAYDAALGRARTFDDDERARLLAQSSPAPSPELAR